MQSSRYHLTAYHRSVSADGSILYLKNDVAYDLDEKQYTSVQRKGWVPRMAGYLCPLHHDMSSVILEAMGIEYSFRECQCWERRLTFSIIFAGFKCTPHMAIQNITSGGSPSWIISYVSRCAAWQTGPHNRITSSPLAGIPRDMSLITIIRDDLPARCQYQESL